MPFKKEYLDIDNLNNVKKELSAVVTKYLNDTFPDLKDAAGNWKKEYVDKARFSLSAYTHFFVCIEGPKEYSIALNLLKFMENAETPAEIIRTAYKPVIDGPIEIYDDLTDALTEYFYKQLNDGSKSIFDLKETEICRAVRELDLVKTETEIEMKEMERPKPKQK